MRELQSDDKYDEPDRHAEELKRTIIIVFNAYQHVRPSSLVPLRARAACARAVPRTPLVPLAPRVLVLCRSACASRFSRRVASPAEEIASPSRSLRRS
mmetsp:Transcript_38030/g.89013  ORF Transcript_38030/g.89013 Transcript_38030/m.89013 type:complete len:98 (-) Transcript_38030:501-794(-)